MQHTLAAGLGCHIVDHSLLGCFRGCMPAMMVQHNEDDFPCSQDERTRAELAEAMAAIEILMSECKSISARRVSVEAQVIAAAISISISLCSTALLIKSRQHVVCWLISTQCWFQDQSFRTLTYQQQCCPDKIVCIFTSHSGHVSSAQI